MIFDFAHQMVHISPLPCHALGMAVFELRFPAITMPKDTKLENRFRIVHAEVKKDERAVGNLNVSISGKSTESGTFVATNVQKLGTGEWVKVTPAKSLGPGEYAIVEMLGEQEMNLYVWDFDVNPNTPPDPSTWQPAPPSAQQPAKQQRTP